MTPEEMWFQEEMAKDDLIRQIPLLLKAIEDLKEEVRTLKAVMSKS